MILIICTTPFQVLIAEKVININPQNKYIFRYISNTEGEKHIYYYQRLKLKVGNSKFISVNSTNKLALIVFLLKLKFYSLVDSFYIGMNKKRREIKILVGSIDNIYVHSYLYGIVSNKYDVIIETFDDGTANIDKNSFLYKERKSKKISFLRFFLCRNLDLKTLKNRSKKHYSIYNKKANIIENVEYLKLIDYSDHNTLEKCSVSSEKIKIFLGQPIYELDISKRYTKKHYIDSIFTIVNNFKIDYYFPHPREDLLYVKMIKDICSIKIIETKKIFEDYFFQNLKSTNKYIIYTFFSGSVFSLIDLPNIEIVLCRVNNFPIDLSEIYGVLSEYSNFSIIDI